MEKEKYEPTEEELKMAKNMEVSTEIDLDHLRANYLDAVQTAGLNIEEVNKLKYNPKSFSMICGSLNGHIIIIYDKPYSGAMSNIDGKDLKGETGEKMAERLIEIIEKRERYFVKLKYDGTLKQIKKELHSQSDEDLLKRSGLDGLLKRPRSLD